MKEIWNQPRWDEIKKLEFGKEIGAYKSSYKAHVHIDIMVSSGSLWLKWCRIENSRVNGYTTYSQLVFRYVKISIIR